MFGVGLPEFAVIFVVAIFVFGPERLPEFARQAGRFLRQVRRFSQTARDDLRQELGPEFADLELRDLDPREVVRKHILEAMDDDDSVLPRKRANGSTNGSGKGSRKGAANGSANGSATAPGLAGAVAGGAAGEPEVRPGLRPLQENETPPYDLEAT